MEKPTGETTPCCPKFNPEPWDEKEITWQDKLFVKDSMVQFMHMPLPGAFAKTVGRMWKKIEEAGANPDIADFLMLAYDPSPWKDEVYINVTKEVPDAENVRLSGTYLTKVFDGPYNAVPKWIQEMARFVNEKGRKVKKYYCYYTTCPKCAKIYGHNYIVFFAEV
ncbi:MAG: hydrolase [Chloroflexota bacterium]